MVEETERTEAVEDVELPGLQAKEEIRGKSNMPCDYSKYPENWKEIRKEILIRAGNRCELCGAENGKPHWKTGSKVVLTIAHLDQDRENNAKYNTRALCQRCHNIIDLPYRIKRRKERERMESGQMRIQDLLIKGLGEEIIIKVKEYLEKNHIKGSEIEINIEIIENDNPYEIKVITTINRKKVETRPIRPERMDYMEKGASIGKPRIYKKMKEAKTIEL